MHYFIGIVPTDEYKERITNFQKKWANNRITEVVEPHITLKAQGGLTLDKEWIRIVESICKNFNSFSVTVSKPMFFGDDILYLSAFSEDLNMLHKNIVQGIYLSEDLIKKYFELDEFTPHITLGKTVYGLSKNELKDMAKLAEEELSPYPTIEVNFIRIYQETEPGIYKIYLDIPLK
ncbi:2'-5' RNA ligase family protein [Paenisporosarcina sp. TG20]|uniref:2'-5' RNA ligase family protein n=1 Tax=Paenisporosarcina sp. TG20 TaxID=1211706 RepID=UPI00030EE1CD|nr:2'-5' RNA ligase family protein [Paenisporosarcina sp. TG20]